MNSAPDLSSRLSVAELPPLEILQREWQALEPRAQPSFFTSWMWIGTWLASLGSTGNARVIRAERGGVVVGMAVIVLSDARRYGVLPVRTAHLHETGLAACDAITVEYNGFLVDREHATTVARDMALGLLNLDSSLDEVRMSAVLLPLDDLPAGLQMRSVPHPSYYVDMAAITASGKDFLGALKQRQRYLVRKSIKKLTESTPLRIVESQTLDEARATFADLERLHTAFWQARGVAGAFGTEFQRRFHARLVETAWSTRAVRLLSVRRGDALLGCFYYFCHAGWVHYYQSGIDYTLFESTESPGLAAHALAIEHFRSEGLKVYDFMAGDRQYKRTLSTGEMTQHWIVLQRRSAKMIFEDFALKSGKRTRDRWRQAQAWCRDAMRGTRTAAPLANEQP